MAGAIESVRDITDYKLAERALRASEERYRAITEASPDAITLIGKDLRISYVSPRSVELHGYKGAEEMIGMKAMDFVPPEEKKRVVSKIDDYLQAGVVHEQEYLILRRDGSAFQGEISAALIRDSEGNPSAWIIITRDITERRMAEEKIRLSEEKFSRAFMSSPLAVLLFDLEDGRFLEVNDRFLELSGFDRTDVVGKVPDDLNVYMEPEQRVRLLRHIRDSGSVREFELQVRNKDGSILETMLSGDVITIEGKSCFIAIMVDITETRQLQKEISTVIEQERQRIGRDLHDDLGQSLTGVTFLLQSLKHDLEGMGGEIKDQVKKIDDLVRSAVAKTRSISRMLSPVEMGEMGLAAALTEMVLQIEDIFIITCQFHGADDVVVPDSIMATNLFYIAREAATNALKHSNANRIDVYLRSEGDAIVLEVQDDGTGLRDGGQAKGLGLRIMQYRAGIMGAQIDFVTHEDGGFSVVVRKRITEPKPGIS